LRLQAFLTHPEDYFMNRRSLILAVTAAIVALASACSDTTAPTQSTNLKPKVHADSLICTITNGGQTCSQG
jgi:hypothetical protein